MNFETPQLFYTNLKIQDNSFFVLNLLFFCEAHSAFRIPHSAFYLILISLFIDNI